MAENKKIKNATTKEYDGIQFKSSLEVSIYKTLVKEGFEVLYEPTKYVIWQGFKPTVPFYTRYKKTKKLVLSNKKIVDITYTPDFITIYKNVTIVIEAKGFQNDVYPYKKKLFRRYLETLYANTGTVVLFFEIFTIKQLTEAITIIKSYDNTREDKKVSTSTT